MKPVDQSDGGWLSESGPGVSLTPLSSRRIQALETQAARVQVPSGPPPCILAVGTTRPDLFAFNALSDGVLLRWLTNNGRRPNALIQCAPGSLDTAMRHLMTWCALPFRMCSLPGTLELPNPARGTLLLKEVGALTLSQQVALYDWLSTTHGSVQVISLSTVSLDTMVEEGEFLEGLLYRLNVVRIDGASGTRPAPLNAWALSSGERTA